MGTYKNDYTKKEDAMLWELHEIRHEISKKYKNKDYSEMNKLAKSFFSQGAAAKKKKRAS